jgi:hypothetical protein
MMKGHRHHVRVWAEGTVVTMWVELALRTWHSIPLPLQTTCSNYKEKGGRPICEGLY